MSKPMANSINKSANSSDIHKNATNETDTAALNEILSVETDKNAPSHKFCSELLQQISKNGRRISIENRKKIWKILDMYDIRNLISLGIISRGQSMETPDILKHENLPMKPPGKV